MEALYFLEGFRTPLLDHFFLAVTALGDETLVMAAVLFSLWIFDRPFGRYLLCCGFLSLFLNQSLKGLFRVARPFILDPSFTIVEEARISATGYSFPSGHTQNAATLYGCLWARFGGAVRRVLLAVTLLVALSRLYLGVHTPADVGASLLLGWGVVLLGRPLLNEGNAARRAEMVINLLLLVFSFGLVGFFELSAPPEGREELILFSQSVKNAYTFLGAVMALNLVTLIEGRWPLPRLKGPLWKRGLLCGAGMGLILLLRVALKYPADALFGHGVGVGDALRYFFIVLFGGAGWPLIFPFFNGEGRQNKEGKGV